MPLDMVDRDEAVLVGREAVNAALTGKSGVMVGVNRLSGEDYRIETTLVPIQEVMLHEKVLPDRYINERGNFVNNAFVEWCKPLIGGELTEQFDLDDEIQK